MVKRFLAAGIVVAGLISGVVFLKRGEVSMVTAHIFIHGTRLSGFSFLSAVPTLKNELKDHHFYKQIVCSTRNDARFYDSQIMLGKGLVPIAQDTIDKCRQCQLPPDESRKAAVQVISGYDTLVRARFTGEHLYYTFGWDGLLSDDNRKQESLILYKALIDLREQLANQYPYTEIKFILHGHSHGGNVILYLGLHENELKQKLVIETALLYGTPIQNETAHFCQHSLFKKIINIYSEGDKIQVADKFSTMSRESRRTFSSILSDYPIEHDKRVVELCVSAAGNKRAFGHAPLYLLGFYGSGTTLSAERVFKIIHPLPVIFFSPLIMDMASAYNDTKGILNFARENPQTCKLELFSDKQKLVSENLVPLIKPIKDVIEKTWKPYALQGYLHLGYLAVADFFTSIPKYTRYKDLKYKARCAAKKKNGKIDSY